MERTEIVSLFKNTPADGTEITVCGCFHLLLHTERQR